MRSAGADQSRSELGREKGEGEVSKETSASGVRRTQRDRCKESTAGGVIWKRGRAEILLGEAPKEMPEVRERERAELSGEEKGRALQAFILLAKSLTTPTKGLCISFPNQGNTSKEMKK